MQSNNFQLMNFLEYTRLRSPELADYLKAVANTPLKFEGEDPLKHSSYNHVHLWKLEYLSDIYDWIDVDYRVDFVKYVLEQWRRRMKGLPPYKQKGYRLYVYEAIAPTISAVAETDLGFPYSHCGKPIFVANIRDVLALYRDRRWQDNFADLDWEISGDLILNSIKKNNGSIGEPTADSLSLQVNELRKLIVNMGLDSQVNKIRQHFQRRPADFSNNLDYGCSWHVFERVLKPGYK